MKKFTLLPVLCCLFFAATAQQPVSTTHFNDNWQFVKSPDTTVYPDLSAHSSRLSWDAVSLPHTTTIEPVIKTAQQWQGISWYRKFFLLDKKDLGRHVTIGIDAAMNDADIYLNGKFLMNHKGGYLPFTLDLSNAGLFGRENCLLIRLNNQDNPVIPPGKPLKDLDFNFYSGLYRNAWMTVQNGLHITDAVSTGEAAQGGASIHYEFNLNHGVTLRLKTQIRNEDRQPLPALLKTSVYDLAGHLLATSESPAYTLEKGESSTIEQAIPLKNVTLWSPAHPVLYKVIVKLLSGGRFADSTSVKTGIRQIIFKADGFYLNGSKYIISGTNRHQEYPYIGYALSDNAQYREAFKIKSAGFDFVRCSHYPPSPAFLDACDQLGIFVMDSTPGWQFFGDAVFQANSLQNIRDLVHRDRNHTSVILWESSLNETQMTTDYMRKANAIVHTELPYADTYTCGWLDQVYDVFIPARQHAKAPDYWKKYARDKPLFLAEYGDWEYYAQNAGFNQTAYKDLTAEEKTSRQSRGDGQKRLLQQALNFQEAHNDDLNSSIAGDANWVMFDYKRGYAPEIESSGIMDIFRLPKYAFFFYQSQLDPALSRPMLFIAASCAVQDELKTLKIFSNCDQVELFRNGASIGIQRPDTGVDCDKLAHPPFTFHFQGTRGEITATGYLKGISAATAVLAAPGKPTQLSLVADISGRPVQAGQNDVFFVYVTVGSATGSTCDNADALVSLALSGDAEIIGEQSVKAEAGIAAFLVKAGNNRGIIQITSSSAGLSSGKLEVSVQ